MSKITISKTIDFIGLVVAVLGVIGQFLTSKEKKGDNHEIQETQEEN